SKPSESRLARIEFGLIALGTLIAGAFAVHLDAFEALAVYVEQHDAWQLDEFIVAFIAGSLGCFILLFRRAGQLRREIDRREVSEELAVKLA
ncbi:hypothetical protein, partial [Limosilactobacillus reuteri]|uniref:hypothetical protein n=1 Tax=Limosilactobacillus reuteri TaxID=1598 RepID=UPI0030F3F471